MFDLKYFIENRIPYKQNINCIYHPLIKKKTDS